GTGGEQLKARRRVFNDAAVEGTTVLQLDFRVFEAVSDDLIWINDVVQERIKCATAHTGEVWTDLRAFTVKFVADETGALGHFVALLQVRFATQHDLPFLGDELEFVLACCTVTAKAAVRVINDGAVGTLRQRAAGSSGNVL